MKLKWNKTSYPTCRSEIRAKGKDSPHHESSLGGVSKFATDYMFMGGDGTPITIPADYDALTKAFFANVVPCKGTSHGYAERELAHNVLSTRHQKAILQRDQEPSIIDAKHKAATHIPSEIVFEESPVGDSTTNGSIERANQTIQGQICAIKDYTERQTGATIGSDGITAHQRIRGKAFNQQIAASGEQIFFKPHKTTGPQHKLAVNWLDGCWLGFNTRMGEHIVSNNAAVVPCRRIRLETKKNAGTAMCCWE